MQLRERLPVFEHSPFQLQADQFPHVVAPHDVPFGMVEYWHAPDPGSHVPVAAWQSVFGGLLQSFMAPDTHVPPTHESPTVQAFPSSQPLLQPPQCIRSMLKSVSHPFDAWPSQFPHPASHDVI